jgi:hypothetical protein
MSTWRTGDPRSGKVVPLWRSGKRNHAPRGKPPPKLSVNGRLSRAEGKEMPGAAPYPSVDKFAW